MFEQVSTELFWNGVDERIVVIKKDVFAFLISICLRLFELVPNVLYGKLLFVRPMQSIALDLSLIHI